MNRSDIIKRLVKEGMTEKTLASFSDKQITALASRMLGEQTTSKGSVVMKKGSNPTEVKKITDTGVNVELREKLVGKQKNIDKNKNGKIDAEDFKLLKKETKEEKPSAGLTAKKKSEVVKAAKAGKDIGKKGKGFKEVEKKAKESGAKNPKAVAAAAMWKNLKRESEEVNNWLNALVETEYHPFTSKKEILDLINLKLNEQAPAIAEPEVKPGIAPEIAPNYEPDEDDSPFFDPFETPGVMPTEAPKYDADSDMPEFMKLKNLIRYYNENK
jgi:hypothetical protein